MTTVVLGWDGLDSDLVDKYGLANSFGEHNQRITTFDNDVLGKPHTYEVWPSIITGVRPDKHGIYAATQEGGVAWGNPFLQRTAQVAQYIVPERLRSRIGALLREHGAGLDVHTPDYYREQGISTVFDQWVSRAISIPNYVTDRDKRLGLDIDRGAELGEFLNIDEDDNGERVHEPKVPLPELEERLVSELTSKLGVVSACLQREYDLIFVWLGYLDTVGHLDPVVDAAGWQERAYWRAAGLTDAIQNQMVSKDTLICVSDHGLRNGNHTHDAFLATSEKQACEDVQSVLDVRGAIERVTPSNDSNKNLDIRSPFQYDDHTGRRDATGVRSQLENLGYI